MLPQIRVLCCPMLTLHIARGDYEGVDMTISRDPHGHPVKLGPDLAVTVPFRAELSELEKYPDVERIDLVMDLVDGVIQPTTITVVAKEGTAVRGQVLRTLPIKFLTTELVSRQIGKVVETPDGSFGATFPFTLSAEERLQIRVNGPTDEALRMVASVYEVGKVMGQPPAKSVEDTLGLPRSTASRWVSLARERGYLS